MLPGEQFRLVGTLRYVIKTKSLIYLVVVVHVYLN